VCSGIEAASVAWHSLGWTPVGFSEIEPFPCAVLAHHFPKVTNYGDMSKFRDWSIRAGDIDLLVGGTPCQSFSVAGLRQGLKDPRGNLMLTFLAIAEHLKPKWILWENVPGVLSSNGGRDFASFLGALGQLGYGFAYRVLDAQWCRTHGHPRAVPQRRRRVFVVGCLGDQRSAAKVLFESESLQRYSAKSKATRQGTAADVDEGVGSGDDLIGGIDYEHNAHGPNDVTDPLLKGSPTGGGHPLPAIAFCKSKRACSTTDNETWVEGVVAPTQNAFDVGDTRATTAILFENHPNDSRVTGPHDVAPSCVSRFGTGGGNVPLVIPAVAIQGTVIGRKDHNGPQGSGCSDGGEMFTLNSTDVHAVAVAPALQVRRLTPTECERLQGFPDGWTAIPWKNKSAEDCPDGPRYKAIGNSMAVNCMEWIGERINAIETQS
jgi:DNA (cytosine-5)-methyltransferase 1